MGRKEKSKKRGHGRLDPFAKRRAIAETFRGGPAPTRTQISASPDPKIIRIPFDSLYMDDDECLPISLQQLPEEYPSELAAVPISKSEWTSFIRKSNNEISQASVSRLRRNVLAALYVLFFFTGTGLVVVLWDFVASGALWASFVLLASIIGPIVVHRTFWKAPRQALRDSIYPGIIDEGNRRWSHRGVTVVPGAPLGSPSSYRPEIVLSYIDIRLAGASVSEIEARESAIIQVPLVDDAAAPLLV